MFSSVFKALLCAFLLLVDAVIEPENLEFAYFVHSSFQGNPDDIYKDQSAKHHNLLTYPNRMYPMFDSQNEYVDFSSNPNDGMYAPSLANKKWAIEWGFSVWLRRDSAADNPLAETDQFILGNMNNRHDGSFDVYVKASKTLGGPATLGFAWTTQENSTAPIRRQKYSGLLCAEGEWHNFVMTGNGVYVTVWLDNERVFFDTDRTFEQPAFGSLVNSSLPLNVGGGENGMLPFQGEMKEVVFYNQFLAMLDVNTLYTSAAVSTYPPTFEPSAAPSFAPTKAPTFGNEYLIASYFTTESFSPPPDGKTALQMLYRDTSGNNHTVDAGPEEWAITGVTDTQTGATLPPIANVNQVCELFF